MDNELGTREKNYTGIRIADINGGDSNTDLKKQFHLK
jgi:hypothetical protein